MSKARGPRRTARRRLIATGVCAFVAVLLADAPASLAGVMLGAAGARYDFASGTLWDGRLHGVWLRGVRLGDIAFGLEPWMLALGRVSTPIDIRGGVVRGKGRVTVGPFGGYALRDGSAEIALDGITGIKVLGAPLSGAATVTVSIITGTSRGCSRADGDVSTDALAAFATQFGSNGFALKGPIRCEKGALVLPLSGAGESVRVTAVIKVQPAGRVVSRADIETQDEQIALALQTLGFRKDNGVWRFETSLGSSGRLR